MFDIRHPTPLQKIEDEFLDTNGITLYVKRDDLIHPGISGNKWRKLKYNLIEAKKQGYKKLLTFGGAFSNHIAAVAVAASEFDFESIGIIRGDELNENSNTTLKQAYNLGMQLEFVSRSKYRQRSEEGYLNQLREEFGGVYTIPEGGSNTLAVKGCTEIINEIKVPLDYVVTAVGTGSTLAGLASGLTTNQQALGISILKGAGYLNKEVEALIKSYSVQPLRNWKINNHYHLGGYAKFDDHLIYFINQFKLKHNIQLDPVYTGKMMMAIYDLVDQKYFEPATRIVALHTGGLQGIAGFNELNGILIQT